MSSRNPLARLLALVLALLLGVGVASADPIARARMAPLAGSERLRLFALGQALQARSGGPAVTQAMRQTMQDAGFYHDGPGIDVLRRSLRATPVLAWDSNINGGYLNDSLDLNGLIFAIDPARQALAGLVGGARASGELRLGWGPGRHLDLRFGVEALYSPRHDIGRAALSVSACARNHLTGWVFADLCASAAASHLALGDSHSLVASATLSRLFASAGGYHELSLGAEHRLLDEGRQSALTLGWAAVWDRATTDISLTLAAPIAGASVQRQRLSVDVGLIWRDRPVTLGLWHAQAGGGMFLGMARQDATSGLSLGFRPRPQITVEAVWQRTRSSIDFFDETRAGLNIRFDLSH